MRCDALIDDKYVDRGRVSETRQHQREDVKVDITDFVRSQFLVEVRVKDIVTTS